MRYKQIVTLADLTYVKALTPFSNTAQHNTLSKTRTFLVYTNLYYKNIYIAHEQGTGDEWVFFYKIFLHQSLYNRNFIDKTLISKTKLE